MINAWLDRLTDIPGKRIALQDERRRITFGDLRTLVLNEADSILASGCERFALLAENSCGWAITDLALRHARKLNVPLPAFFSTTQLEHVLRDAGIDEIYTDRPQWVRDQWPEFVEDGISLFGGLTLLRRFSDPATTNHVPAGTIKITYTSGSTAEPKGVCLTADALDAVTESLAAVTAPLGIVRHQCLLPLATLLENIAGIYTPLLSGATCVLQSTESSGLRFDGVDVRRLLHTIATSEPESLILVPELLQLLVVSAERGWQPPGALKFIAVGGASVSPQLLDRATRLGLPVYQGYGLSECASVVCLNTPQANRPGSVGRPLPHIALRCDESGELHVRGDIFSGYLNGPGADEEWATGDLGEIDTDGFVYIRGRRRNLFITSFGRNVSPEWIESELLQEAGIRQACVFGEGRPFPVALLTPLPQIEKTTLAQVIARVNGRLPEYARIGRWAVFSETPSLTNGLLTGNGRLKRETIAQRFSSLIDSLYTSPESEQRIPA